MMKNQAEIEKLADSIAATIRQVSTDGDFRLAAWLLECALLEMCEILSRRDDLHTKS